MNSIIFKVPGRICLFGDKVDLLGMPVIAATIDKFMHFEMMKRDDNMIHFLSKDYPDEEEVFSINNEKALFFYDNHLKYWHACLKSLENYIKEKKIYGFDAIVKSDIPIGAGLSTSAAVSVGFISGLNKLFKLGLSRTDIAEHAYNAEHNILGIMCGRMDQYSIAFGGVTFIKTGEEPGVEILDVDSLPLVVGDSCEPREAKKVLNRVKKELEKNNPIYISAFKKIHEIVLNGKKYLQNGCNLDLIGTLMTAQQEQENIILAATDKLNELCNISINKGAFGAKQMGAGGGGCMVACCPDKETQSKVVEYINKSGGRANIFQIYKYPDDIGEK